MSTTSRAGRHLGCETWLTVVAPALGPEAVEALLDRAEAELERLEGHWSRFRPTSDICRANAAAGTPVPVAPETLDVVALAIDAWRDTGALFDPTVHDALVAAGYDRTFDDLPVASDPSHTPDSPHGPDLSVAPVVPGCVGIELDRASGTLTLPEGTALDLGGIGKGRAADLVLGLLLEGGATGACVNLGGDVRVAGPAPDGGPWIVGIADPFDDGRDLATVVLAAGGVATSARTRRTWGRSAHHLIDPATGRPAERGLAQVSVLAADAVTAEVLAKAAFVAGEDWALDLLAAQGVTGLVVTDDARVVPAAHFDLFAFAPVGAPSREVPVP